MGVLEGGDGDLIRRERVARGGTIFGPGLIIADVDGVGRGGVAIGIDVRARRRHHVVVVTVDDVAGGSRRWQVLSAVASF